jgi:hypothetical protein
MGIWIGSKPKTCDLCKEEFSNTFIDGRTIYGVWALMCAKCHEHVGIGLGTGNGQEYQLVEGGDWDKVSG